jgi:hypothetical protein
MIKSKVLAPHLYLVESFNKIDIITNNMNMDNPNYGNNLLKSNLLSSIYPKKIAVDKIKSAYDLLHASSKVSFHNETIPIYVSSGFFSELNVVHNHVINNPFIVKGLMTMDKIPMPSKSNPHPDVLFN